SASTTMPTSSKISMALSPARGGGRPSLFPPRTFCAKTYLPQSQATRRPSRRQHRQRRPGGGRTIEDIIAVGNELLAVNEALPHGQFIPWLGAEFGWTKQTA